MKSSRPGSEEKKLLPPTGRDAQHLSEWLQAADFAVHALTDPDVWLPGLGRSLVPPVRPLQRYRSCSRVHM
jgi:hypothetical protein